MADAADAVTPPAPAGVVRIGAVELGLTPLTPAETRALRKRMRAQAVAAAPDPYTLAAPTLKRMREAGDADAWREAVARVAEIAASPRHDPDPEWFTTPEACAVQLHAYSRRCSPGVTLDAIRAIVTEYNADDLFAQMAAALLPPAPATPAAQ